MRILVVDDDADIRDTLALLLEANGHEVLAAANGHEALRRMDEQPEFVLCDVEMPGLKGFDVLERVRARPDGRTVPFIFLTGRAERENQRRGMELGADDYLTKPFGEREVLAAIEARARRQQTVRERIDALVEEQRHVASAAWSHELLTPLTGVLGGLDLIEAEAERLSPAELRELLAMVRAGAERQQRLSRKLIAYFELLNAGARSAEADDADLGGLVDVAAREAAAETGRAGDLAVAAEPALAAVEIPRVALAVRELVENAGKFSPPGTPVSVAGRVAGGRYVVTVDDRGCGMSAEERAQIGAFVQFDRSRREQQGLGLGLAIVRLVAARAGGAFRLEASPGGGTRAVLELPLPAAGDGR